MTPEFRRQAEALFQIAVDLAPNERSGFLDERCGSDRSLRLEVERLLAPEASELDGFLRTPLYPDARQIAEDCARLPDRIGHYTIVRKVGEGGMGVVYEAKQDSPHRTVALKVIRSTLPSTAVARRFAQEAEILGRLDHPGIAHIYEAGMTALDDDSPDATRYPFFAMEFIRGRTLLSHADEEAYDIRARMELVAAVCDAVHHAHQNGIVHRDLKPANIIVNQSGHPKVLDFGVARVTDEEAQTRTLQTGAGQLFGTLPYMSPEHVTGDPTTVDARSDVYALGVILFELLAGRLPYDLRDRSIPEAARVIGEEEPTRLSSVNLIFRGDIETIVGKAMEKDPSRRYQTAAALASDLRRYLRDEPIVARPASAFYQFRKFAKRNRALVGGVAATMIVLVAGALAATMLAVRESDARRIAEDRTTYAERLAYRTSIAAAAAALREHDCAGAAQHLRKSPKTLRGWEWRHLMSRLDDSLAVIDTGGIEVGSMAFNETDRTWRALVRVSDGRPAPAQPGASHLEVQVFDALGAKLRSRRSLPALISVMLDKSGSRLACTGIDKMLYIENAVTGQDRIEVGPIPACQGSLRSVPVALLRNGDFVMRMADGTLSRFDPSTGHVLDISGGEGRYGQAFAISRDETKCAYMVGGLGRTEIHVRDVESGALLHTFRGHSESVLSLAFSPDGRSLASGSADRTVRVWKLDDIDEPVSTTIDGHTDRVGAVAFSPDGRVLASASQDRTIRLWNAATFEPLAVYVGHDAEIVGLAFSHDGGILASSDANATIRLWDASGLGDPRVLRGHSLYVYPVALSPDGNRIASGSWDGTVRLWDAASGARIIAIPNPQRERTVVTWLAFSPDGSTIVATENSVQIPREYWLREIRTDTGNCRIAARGSDPWTQLAFEPHGRFIAATGAARGSLSILSARDLTEVRRLQGSEACAYSPSGSVLATADGTDVLVYDTSTFKLLARLDGNEQTIHAVAFDTDGSRLASAGFDHTVRVWDTGTWRALATLEGHTDRVYCVAFSPDGSRLASGSNDQTIRLWNTATWQEVAQLRGHRDHVFSLAFSDDGSQLFSGSGDYTVRVWDTQPLRDRIEARRRRAEAVRALDPTVESLFRELGSIDDVVSHLQQDPSLDSYQREISLQLALAHMHEGRR